MATKTSPSPRIHSQFQVSSGCLCYGALHNIWHGASSARVQGLRFTPPALGGTVIGHSINYNISAKNGTWNVYQLVAEKNQNVVMGWFVAHVDVNPQAEIDKVLRVSGSPYEPDSGWKVNSKQTVEQGVFVINRYDWGRYNKRAKDEVNDPDGDYLPEALGLVDYEVAKEQVSRWCGQSSDLRDANIPSAEGTWLHVTDGEYMFGRFGFDATRDAAHSFIFFTTVTEFSRTCLAGVPDTLRPQETPQEHFERKVREGEKFDGICTIHRMALRDLGDLPPPPEFCLGPHEQNDYIVEEGDLVVDSPAIQGPIPLCSGLKDENIQLLNELVLTYLAKFVKPLCSTPMTLDDALSTLFPPGKPLPSYMIKCFTEPDKHLCKFSVDAVGERIKRFLTNSATLPEPAGDGPPTDETNDDAALLPSNPAFITGMAKGIGFILSEILESSWGCARNCGHTGLAPMDIRISVMNDDELLSLISCSWVFWNGESNEVYPEDDDPIIVINKQIKAERAAREAGQAEPQPA